MNAKKSPSMLHLLFLAVVLAILPPAAVVAQSNAIPCPATAELPPLDILDSVNGALKGTLYTVSQQVNMPIVKGGGTPTCYPQWVRSYTKNQPSSWNPSSQTIANPTPGPVLRARTGDMIELSFFNVIDANKFPNVDTGKCDQTTTYPGSGSGADQYPDCFAGSVYTNVHYHGTHTNPNTTGDNVFLEIAPSPRAKDGTNTPVILPASAQSAFNDYFAQCEAQLKPNPGPKIWPLYWQEIPSSTQTFLLNNVNTNGPAGWYQQDLQAIAKGKWPQYYASTYPYCYKLPNYTQGAWPPAPQADTQTPHTHGEGSIEVEEAENPTRPLIMGQAPGTHWYHAHKHGSTTINVMNGMTGVFIIEGKYDDDINAYYGANWTRTAKVMVINQLTSYPALVGLGGGGPGNDFAVNGAIRPTITMAGNSVQMWRMANTSSRSGAFFLAPAGIQWMQLAQDGVQFNNTNYRASSNTTFLMAAGNRVDLLVKAPPYVSGGKNTYNVLVYNTVDPSDRPPQSSGATPLTLVTVVVTPNGPTMNFMPQAPTFPPYLADITPSEVQGTQTITFASSANHTQANPSAHTINGQKFNGQVGASVLLNKVEEWKIVNETYPPATGNQISHPFHIHINPFQIFEFFDPNSTISATNGPGTVTTNGTATVTGTGTSFTRSFVVGDFIWINGLAPGQVIAIASPTSLTMNYAPGANTGKTYQAAIPLYTINKNTQRPGQCYLDPNLNTTWHPCTNNVPQTNAVWWDVFSIPSGNIFYANATTSYPIPGYFKMRSRFVDFFGSYVMHCHILAHEDRGMMTVVRVDPLQSDYSHH
ncbi:MAG TPA: multicopper oxidase domain-containing protein [Thermoanaerobaculia bacterium]|jgi:FtsP/CotA-like multicopper oxidase with cupredoxin domain|nr:multicopper oxidase domain-containing protein [Thermoanaerobaculia bacterium]